MDIEQLKTKAEKGDKDAMHEIGRCYANGEGVARDMRLAIVWLNKAAEQGHAVAMRNLGKVLNYEDPPLRDLQKAFYWYQKAANAGDATAMFLLGCMYRSGEGVSKDGNKAFDLFEKAAKKGNAQAQRNMGVYYEKVGNNPKKAFTWYEKAAKSGLTSAMCNVARMLMEGDGVSRNVKKAIVWLEKATEKESKLAMWNLATHYVETAREIQKGIALMEAVSDGTCELSIMAQGQLAAWYGTGDFMPEDEEKERYWTRRSADNGDAESQFMLGHAYEMGLGVNQSMSEAIKWYQKAAGQGHERAKEAIELCGKDMTGDERIFQRNKEMVEAGEADAQILYNLGTQYWAGEGTRANVEKAVEYFEEAANEGHVDAQYTLGVMLLAGTEIPKDVERAKQWLTKAAEQGHVDAQYGLVNM